MTREVALAARCVVCHRPGAAQNGTPPIAGRPAEEIAQALRRFRDHGPPRDVMTTRASRLSDADIDALSRVFAAAPADRPRER